MVMPAPVGVRTRTILRSHLHMYGPMPRMYTRMLLFVTCVSRPQKKGSYGQGPGELLDARSRPESRGHLRRHCNDSEIK